jgi:Flp pilus assembly protein TadG
MKRHSSRRLFGRLRSSKGATLVEAAIITPLLLLITFSIVDFGSIFYVYLALENGVSQATRYAVTGNTMNDASGTAMSRTETLKAAMRQATPTLNIPDSAFSFQHMAVGGSTFVGGVGGPNEIEKVTIDYTWTILTPVLRPFFTNGQIHFRVESTMKNEGRFQ